MKQNEKGTSICPYRARRGSCGYTGVGRCDCGGVIRGRVTFWNGSSYFGIDLAFIQNACVNILSVVDRWVNASLIAIGLFRLSAIFSLIRFLISSDTFLFLNRASSASSTNWHASGEGTVGIVRWCMGCPGSGFWKEHIIWKTTFPFWTAFTERVV